MMSRFFLAVVLSALSLSAAAAAPSHDYGDALTKCIMFFEGQRSGKLPDNQRLTWRKDSALKDGSDIGMDLVGGYYDAGDNVKFHLPMSFSTTMLGWSVVVFGNKMGYDDLKRGLEAVRWGTDYFMKATSVPGRVVAQVADPVLDHDCWERPEDMDTPRNSYVLNTTNPGSEIAGEIAAALAAGSVAFSKVDPQYSKMLLKRAAQVFEFGDKNRGSYSKSVPSGACPFYCSPNGYMDELAWGAAWMFRATGNDYYLNYGCKLIGLVFLWQQDDAFASNADNLVCSILPESPYKTYTYTPGT
ncbi:Endoglucanase 24 [Linum perenne]